MDLLNTFLVAGAGATGLVLYARGQYPKYTGAKPWSIGQTSTGCATAVMPLGTLVRTVDMNRVTRDGRVVPHKGVDLGAPMGTPIYSLKGGTVAIASVLDGYGNCVVITHAPNLCSLYGHLNKYRVAAGQQVEAGEMIGEVGNSGVSGGPHLHLEVHNSAQPNFGNASTVIEPTRWLAQNGVAQYLERYRPQSRA